MPRASLLPSVALEDLYIKCVISGIRSNLFQLVSQGLHHRSLEFLGTQWQVYLSLGEQGSFRQPALAEHLDGCAENFPEHREVWLRGTLDQADLDPG